MACIFFGHRDCYSLDFSVLKRTIEELIAEGEDTFYVGHQGHFDSMVLACLNAWRVEHTTPDKIKFSVFSCLITCNTSVLLRSSTSPLQKILIWQVEEFISRTFFRKAQREICSKAGALQK